VRVLILVGHGGQPLQDEAELDGIGFSIGIGFSHHSVPSLSNTATRSSGGR
jgi:hypothetical protein